jgi:hypothetical protein
MHTRLEILFSGFFQFLSILHTHFRFVFALSLSLSLVRTDVSRTPHEFE